MNTGSSVRPHPAKLMWSSSDDGQDLILVCSFTGTVRLSKWEFLWPSQQMSNFCLLLMAGLADTLMVSSLNPWQLSFVLLTGCQERTQHEVVMCHRLCVKRFPYVSRCYSQDPILMAFTSRLLFSFHWWADMEVPSESFYRSSWDSRTCYRNECCINNYFIKIWNMFSCLRKINRVTPLDSPLIIFL